jgi:hypothetical protein
MSALARYLWYPRVASFFGGFGLATIMFHPTLAALKEREKLKVKDRMEAFLKVS